MASTVVESSVLQKLVEQASSLYSLPAIAIDVLKLTEQPKVDVSALKGCIERDPALTSKLLRVVNSSLFGLSCKVSDLNQALTLLGVKPLKLLVLGFSLPPSLFAGVAAETLRRYWRFTLIKATAARQLSRRFWSLSEDEAFIAGLLQEIGALVLIQQLGRSYVDFLVAANRQGAGIRDLEVETLGFDHTILSARLLEHWKLPESLVAAVAQAHDTDALAQLPIETGGLPQILHLASLIAAIIVDGRQDFTAGLYVAGERYRDISAEQFSDLLDEIQQQVVLLGDLFSMPINDETRYRDILLQAHRQLSEAAAEVFPAVVSSSEQDHLGAQRQTLGLAMQQLEAGFSRRTSAPPQAAVETSTRISREVSASVSTRRATSTGDQRFVGKVTAALSQGRLNRCDVSLILVEAVDYERLLVQCGPPRAARVIDSLQHGMRHICDAEAEYLLVTDSRWAILMIDCECRDAVGYARQMVERLPGWLIEQQLGNSVLEFRSGIATVAYPSRHFSSEQVVEAAERCLFAASSSGLQTVKSIDLV